MAWILNALHSVQDALNCSSTSAQMASLDELVLPELKKLNSFVYELCKSSGSQLRRPSVEIVFFHGIQFDRSEMTHLTTWLSKDRTECWLLWILKHFPEARILLISYDGCVKKSDDAGCTDMYVTSENLWQDLIDDDTHVGQDGCPVVLVGHSLGGLVMKEVLLKANSVLNLDPSNIVKENLGFLLQNVKHLFYYSCPHNGTRLADIGSKFLKGQLFEHLTILNKEAARCNDAFRRLRHRCQWKAFSIVEALPTDLVYKALPVSHGSQIPSDLFYSKLVYRSRESLTYEVLLLVSFANIIDAWMDLQSSVPGEGQLGRHIVVEEASARYDTDDYYTAHDADHVNICRPESTTDASFSKLKDVINRALAADVNGHKVRVSCDKVVGLDDQVEMVRHMLQNSRQVGLFGPGGIGKTTLAKLVHNDMADNFEYTCFVSEVKGCVTQKASLEDLQVEILKNLYYKGQKVNIQWSRLLGKRVLIVLDDVHYESQILVLTESNGFSTKSCVLLTSRDQQILRRKHFEVYPVRFLDDESSRRLFCNHAFNNAIAPECYNDRVERFTRKCKGWPLILEVAGKYLCNQEEGSVWDDAFDKLSQAKPLDGKIDEDEFWPIFTVIYQSIAREEQRMFLDIAICFHDEGLESVKRAWRVCRPFADAGWQNLLDMGLVTTPITTTGMIKIQMHEVLRDLGRSIACADPRNIRDSSRVCYHIDSSPWPFEQGNSEVEILKIVSYGGQHHYPRDGPRCTIINTGKLRGLENLKALWLDGVTLRGAWDVLPAKLEFLKVKGDEPPYESITSGRFRSDSDDDSWALSCLCREVVCELVLQLVEVIARKAKEWYSTLRAAFSQPHPTLRHVEIEKGRSLGPPIDTLDQLKVLEYLSFEVCCSRDLPYSFKQHRALKYLRIGNYEDTALPGSLADLQALEHLEIRHSQLDFLPDSLGQFRALKSLTIGGYQQETIPDSLGQLSALRSLTLRFCNKLSALPSTLGELSDLKSLTLSHCQKLRALPPTVGQLLALNTLALGNCYELSALPSTLGQLKALQRLDIAWCTRLRALPETLGQLDGLRTLRFYECPCLESLPLALGELQALSYLVITQCTSLKALPPRLWELSELQHFEIDWAESYHSLKTLKDILENFEPRQLQRLCVWSREDPRTVKHTLGQLDALKHLPVWIGKNRFDRAGQDLHGLQYFEIRPDNYPD